MNLFRPTVAEINLNHLRQNYTWLRGLASSQSFFCPVVKANAYGHGDVEIARELIKLGCDWLCVGSIEEGVRLRDAGIKVNILVLGLFAGDGAEAILDSRLTPVVSEWYQLTALEDAARRQQHRSFGVHLKFNTGMNRLGFNIEEAKRLAEWFASHSSLSVQGLCTHLAQGEDSGQSSGVTFEQLRKFDQACAFFPAAKLNHSHNCAALLGEYKTNKICDRGIRPGISLYGYSPLTKPTDGVNLRPVMSVKSRLVCVRDLKPGDQVSYGGTYRAKEARQIGIVPIGYADGFRRALSGQGHMLYKGRRVPVIGRVCMDYTMIDVTSDHGASAPQAGDEVVICGVQNSASIWFDEIAGQLDTISYEILTGISDRVPRKFVYE